MIFCSLTSPASCNSPRKCTPVKYKKRQKAGFPIVTLTNFLNRICTELHLGHCQTATMQLFSEAGARSSSVKKVLLEISQKSQENTCVKVSFLITLQDSGLGPATLLEKRLWHRCFNVNFVKFLRTPFHTEHLWWVLLFFTTLVHYF